MYIGIDLGGTNIAVGIVDNNGNILRKGSIPTKPQRHYTEIIKDMAFITHKVIKDAGYSISDMDSIGIGSPGSPNKKDGILVYANNINFYNVPMRAEMQKHIQLPVHIDNDANCAALAEAMVGAAKGANHSITITLGTGVGAGIIIGKNIYSGFNDAAGELGHMVIVTDGQQCTCGRKGCWEAYASATALIRQTKEAAKANPDSIIHKLVNGDLEKVNGKIAFDAAKAGDKIGESIVKKYIYYIAVGVSNIINIFQPEVLVVGGGICKEGDYLLNPIREVVSRNVYCKDIPQTEIKTAQLGNDAGIIGAAFLGANQ